MKARGFNRTVFQVSLAGAFACTAIAAGGAHAATLTVGSPLTTAPAGTFAGTATEVNFVLAEPGARITSPVTGTIVSYQVNSTNDGRLAIRAIRPVGGGLFQGVGTSTPAPSSGTGLQTFSANVPINTGDFVGLDLVDPDSGVGQANVVGSTVYEWGNSGFLADGATEPPKNIWPDFELLFNAQVQTSNTLAVGKTQRSKKKGTATLNLTAPNPGTLTATGNGAKVSAAGGTVAAGPVKLRIKAKGKKAKTLNSKGKVTVKVAIAYTPNLGDAGTQSIKVKLKK